MIQNAIWPLVLLPFMAMVLALLLVWGFVKWRQSRQKAEVLTKLIDRFGTSQELADFMNSPSGAEFLKTLNIAGPGGSPGGLSGQVLSAVRVGIILIMLGLGAFVVTMIISNPVVADVFSGAGILSVALGVGFLVAAAASVALSKRLGLLEPRETAKRIP
ncbi:MAG: hypothetical protein JXQ27_04450 [Acidobacteria bacterium]|nr:hypothetical protein [Acidobacteriota bacterium]